MGYRTQTESVKWKGKAVRYVNVLFGIVVFGMVVLCSAVEPVADPDPNRFAKAIESFENWDSKNATPADPILFVGSSSIVGWRTHDSFPEMPVINRGFGGSHFSDLLHYADRVVMPYKPKVIVVYEGDNDVAGGKSARRVLADYRRFVARVHAEFPKTPVIFITIKPSRSRWKLWPVMNEANSLIKKHAETDTRLFFADLATPLLGPDGRPDASLFKGDALHLNDKGYARWTQVLRPIIKRAAHLNK